ncbi:uncharacterized protein DUF1396 [Bacillus oleivorans]|uniref:Uncharacterized protein DUF1396 n=1 Tax=Bacillus oleivorans TaxID=1448271 RepID=A0A285D3W9_9BACI|nr:DUF4367 domain-containing protein [Bacillus oleivorans]SNX74469.1 uncharacterized protein DUF1396 [Bacillus oleivorans]
MKKFSLLLLGFLFIMALAACGADKSLDKSEVLSKSVEATKSLESYSVEMNMDIDMMDMKSNLTATGDITHNPDAMYLNLNMGMPGMSMDMEMYLQDEEAYMSMFGEWMKMDAAEMGISDFDQLNQEEMEKLTQFTEQFEMTEEENAYVLKLSGNDESYKVLIEDLVMSSMGDFSGDPYMEEMIESIKINKLDLEIRIDKETFFQTAQTFDVELEMVEEGTTTPIKLKGDFTTSNLNKVEPIEIPAEVKENAVAEEEMDPFAEGMSVEEIQELVTYTVPQPAELPEGYVYTEGYYDETMDSVMLSYDKDPENWVMVTVYPTEVMSLADMEGEPVTVHGTDGIYYEMDGYFSVSWEQDGLLIELAGVGTELTKEQLIEIAESVQ